MIVRIRGQLGELTEESAILDRDGLSYEILLPACALEPLLRLRGHDITLHTQEYLEGNAAGGNLTPRMIGFLTAEDRAFFRTFLTVKGMGVKKGLRALAVPAARLAAMIESADIAGLTKLPGIGRRMAEQIVAELKGKLAEFAIGAPPAQAAASDDAFTRDQRDAIEIIVAWGDHRADAHRWIARAAEQNESLTGPEAWVKAAYKVKAGA